MEVTSGNMGSGLAIVCQHFGNPFTAFMSEGNSLKRREMLQALGTNLRLVKQVDGSPGRVTGTDIKACFDEAQDYIKKTGAFYAD